MVYSIRTAGGAARKFCKYAVEKGGMTIASFVDNNHRLWGKQLDGHPVESVMGAFQKYRDGKIDKIIIATEQLPVKEVRNIARELVGIGFVPKDILIVPIEFFHDPLKNLSLLPLSEYNYLEYLEFHLTNRCNLNCAGCAHFVPIIPKDNEVDFCELKKDLAQLKKLVSHIGNIRIMGGEPLLSSHVAECCEYTRRLFPYSNIRIVSNGSLVMSMSREVLETMKKNDLSFDITCYPPFYERYEQIAEFLNTNGIGFHMDIRWGMCPVLHQDDSHKFRHDDTSLVCECYNLYNGNLFPCPVMAYIDFFNHHYHQRYPSGEGTDIYRIKTFQEFWEDITRTKKLCNFCDHYGMTKNNRRRPFRLSKKEPEMEDWLRDYSNKD